MAIITEAKFELRHLVDISATTKPSTTEFTEWIAWAEGKMLDYLQCGNTLPTDVGDILESVSDDLLIRKWHYEKAISKSNPIDAMQLHVHSTRAILDLTTENKKSLDNLKGQSATIEVPGFNFDLDTTTGGFD